MKKRTIIFILFSVLVSGLLLGCSVLSQKIEQYSTNKEKCYINSNNVTQFTYKGKSYTVLEDTVIKENLGSLLGYIRKLVVIDANGKVLIQQDTEKATFKTVSDIANKEQNAFAVIPFLNVYESKDSIEKDLILDVNGKYHKAVYTEAVKNSDKIFHYKQKQSVISDGHFMVNPKNCTQLISMYKVYQITDKTVPDKEIGKYIDIIAKSIVFDKETKLEIPQKDLGQINWSGKEANKQKRENWSYGEVHVIQNVDVSNSVAVEINSKYRIAICQ